MSFDLEVRCTRGFDAVSLGEALAKIDAELADDTRLDPRAHAGAIPLRVRKGKRLLEAAPEWHAGPVDAAAASAVEARGAVRAALQRATRSISLTCGGADEEIAATWILAAAAATAGAGVVLDPQEGEHATPAAAWKRARSLLRDVLPAATKATPEERFVARLRRNGLSEAAIERELGLFRPKQLQKEIDATFAPLFDRPGELEQLVRARPALSEEELAALLDRAWQARSPGAAGAIARGAPPAVLVAHLAAAVAMVGVAARVYVEFLVGAGALADLPEAARASLASRASTDDVRAALASPPRAGAPPSSEPRRDPAARPGRPIRASHEEVLGPFDAAFQVPPEQRAGAPSIDVLIWRAREAPYQLLVTAGLSSRAQGAQGEAIRPRIELYARAPADLDDTALLALCRSLWLVAQWPFRGAAPRALAAWHEVHGLPPLAPGSALDAFLLTVPLASEPRMADLGARFGGQVLHAFGMAEVERRAGLAWGAARRSEFARVLLRAAGPFTDPRRRPVPAERLAPPAPPS